MRRLLRILVILLVCWLALWGVASFAVPEVVDAMVAYAIPTIERAGIRVDSLDYGTVKVSPTLTGATARGISAVFDLSPTDKITLSSSFVAGEAAVRLTQPLRLRGDLTIDDFEISFHETDRPRRLFFDRLTQAHVHIDDLPLSSPRTALLEIFRRLDELFLENTLVGNVEFYGQAIIRIDDLRVPAELYTERQGDNFHLRFRQHDIEALATAAEVALSTEQIEIVSLFPLRVPTLIQITRQSRSLSRRHYPRHAWLQDALRHVAWSFLLTREFGPEFAKEVTDAQEAKPGNTANERAMDFHNNAVGRRFASDGTQLADLPGLVGSDPNVIRHPDEAGSRPELWR